MPQSQPGRWRTAVWKDHKWEESEVFKNEQPVVDGELHDGVTIDRGLKIFFFLPLCLLCGQLVVENLGVGKLCISEISLAGFLFSTFYIFLLSLKIPSLPVKLLIWQAVQFKELLR